MDVAEGDRISLRADLLEHSEDLFLAVDVETAEVVDVNQTLCEVTAYDREELLGMEITKIATVSDAAAWRETLPKGGEGTHVTEKVLTGAEGEQIRTEGSISRIHSDNGEYVVELLRDTTGRDEQLRELERYRAFVEHSSDVITVIDDTGTVEYVSPASRDVSGHEPEELIGTTGLEHVHPDDTERVEETLEKLVANPDETVTHEYRFRCADSSWVWVETTASNQLDDDDIEGLVLVSRDISESKEREHHLRELTGEYEALFENADDAIFLIDVDNTVSPKKLRYERLNPYHEAATGLVTEEVRGLTPTETFGDDLGSEVEANYRRCVRKRKPISYEETLDLPEGEVVWQTSLAPVIVADEVTRVVGISRDVTERRQYERRLERQRDDLTMLNQVLRHDIRNDLQVVQVYAEGLQTKYDDEGQKDIQRIIDSAGHAVDLTKTAREMADVMLTPADDKYRVQLQPVLESELDRIRGAHPDALITVDGSLPKATVMANDMLDSVFRNLLKNAIQHNDKTVPKVCLSASRGEGSVVVRVGDNGPGITQHQRDSIFGKGEKGLESAGAGIGLYLVRTLVDSYGGEVWVEDPVADSPDGDEVGVTFAVELPLVE